MEREEHFGKCMNSQSRGKQDHPEVPPSEVSSHVNIAKQCIKTAFSQESQASEALAPLSVDCTCHPCFNFQKENIKIYQST